MHARAYRRVLVYKLISRLFCVIFPLSVGNWHDYLHAYQHLKFAGQADSSGSTTAAFI